MSLLLPNMIQSIEIHNFKNLSGLKIPGFSRVNLISGKNNVGKSSLLEALEIHIANSSIVPILESRGELYKTYSPGDGIDLFKQNYEALSSLFTGRNGNADDGNNVMAINDGRNLLSMQFRRYTVVKEEDNNALTRQRIVFSPGKDFPDGDVRTGLVVERGARGKVMFQLEHRLDRLDSGDSSRRPDIARHIKIEPDFNDSALVSRLWDSIALTDKEDYVIGALKIIEPGIESLAFLESPAYKKDRYPVARIAGVNHRIPLRSMGDGINHILCIILSLVNCEDGCVLIDEIDNGLHYTVQKQLWGVVFDLAAKLNVQVFATTHSSDCISSFGKVACMNEGAGKYIRLEYRAGSVRAVEYDAGELEIVAAQNIEIR